MGEFKSRYLRDYRIQKTEGTLLRPYVPFGINGSVMRDLVHNCNGIK